MTKRVGRRGGSLRERLLGPLLGGTERRLAPRAIPGVAPLVRAPRFSGIDGAIDGPLIARQSTVWVGIGRSQSPALGSIALKIASAPWIAFVIHPIRSRRKNCWAVIYGQSTVWVGIGRGQSPSHGFNRHGNRLGTMDCFCHSTHPVKAQSTPCAPGGLCHSGTKPAHCSTL
jgi:hypothetical protein